MFNIQKDDFRSIFGSNCRHLCEEMNVARVEDIIAKNIKMPIEYEMEVGDSWRIPFLKELLSTNEGSNESEMSKKEIQGIIDFICGE